MKKILLILVLVFLVLSSFNAAAQYPNQDIKMITGWGVGGGSDAITRMISKMAENLLPVSVYVVNIEGAASGIGAKQVMDAKPDGYTLGTFTYDAIVSVPREELVPGYDLDNLKLIAMVTSEPDGITVRSDSKWETIEELIEDAKANPGEISIGTSGVVSGEAITVTMIEQTTGAEFNLLSYPGGSGGRKEGLLNGEMDVCVASFGDMADVIESGDVRPLAEAADGRNPAFPDVPTFKELGYDVVRGSFIIVGGPAGMPDDVLEMLDEVFYEAQHSEEFRNWLKSIGVSPTYYGMSEVTEWAMNYQEQMFEILDELEANQ